MMATVLSVTVAPSPAVAAGVTVYGPVQTTVSTGLDPRVTALSSSVATETAARIAADALKLNGSVVNGDGSASALSLRVTLAADGSGDIDNLELI